MDYVDDPILAPIKMILEKKRSGLIVDIGCGEGRAMRWIPKGFQLIGIDPDIRALKKAKQFGDVIKGTGEYLPFQNRSVNIVLMEDVLHHSNSVERCICETSRCLEKDGLLAMSETVEENPIIKIGRWLYPYWQGNRVTHGFKTSEVNDEIRNMGKIVKSEKTGLFTFLIFEFAHHFRFLQKYPCIYHNITDYTFAKQPLDCMGIIVTKLIKIESLFHKRLNKYSSHYIVLVEKQCRM